MYGTCTHMRDTFTHMRDTCTHMRDTCTHMRDTCTHTVWGTPAHIQYEGHLHTYSMRDTCTHTVWGTPAHIQYEGHLHTYSMRDTCTHTVWGTLCGEAIDLCTLCFGVREDCINCTEALHTVCRWAGNLIVEWLADSPCSASPDGIKPSAYSFTLTHYQWWGVLCLSLLLPYVIVDGGYGW